MSTYGLTSNGFVLKPLSVIKAELEDAFRAAFGQGIDVSPTSVFGQIIGIIADRLSEGWELAEAVNAAFDPDAATGIALDKIAGITGTIRLPATSSTCVITCTGSPNTTLPTSRVVSVTGVGSKFVTDEQRTLLSVASWTPITSYAIGDRVTNGGRVYQCTGSGVSASSGGPSGSSLSINDGSAQWRYLGQGTAAIDVSATAQVQGPIIAPANTLTTIETPIAGWSSATNVLDADAGTNLELDPALRIRREVELQGSANAALDAIRAKVLRVGQTTNNPVTSCVVFQNVTMSTDPVTGLPPKSVEVLVEGGDDEDVRRAVFSSVGAGIETYGSNSGVVLDKSGQPHTIKFSRPNDLLIYVTTNVSKDPSTFPTDGVDQIKAAIVSFGAGLSIGRDVVANACAAQAFKISGVLDVTSTFIGVLPSPSSSATIVCGIRDRARFDTSRVIVNAVDGSP